jgi:hypothetical protein
MNTQLLIDTIEKEFKEDLEAYQTFREDMWSALANIKWFHGDDKKDSGLTFREAGSVVAGISGHGDYLTYYCSSPDGQVTDKIAQGMAKHGWRWETY